MGDVQDHATAILEQVHGQAVRAPIKEAAESLQHLLSGRIAAYIVNVKDAKTITRWATSAVEEIRPESEQRLRAAYEIMILLSRYEGQGTVRAWFLGMNPHLGDDAPADALREGRLQEALGAARSFVAYGANYG